MAKENVNLFLVNLAKTKMTIARAQHILSFYRRTVVISVIPVHHLYKLIALLYMYTCTLTRHLYFNLLGASVLQLTHQHGNSILKLYGMQATSYHDRASIGAKLCLVN